MQSNAIVYVSQFWLTMVIQCVRYKTVEPCDKVFIRRVNLMWIILLPWVNNKQGARSISKTHLSYSFLIYLYSLGLISIFA